jgi:[acyl-carrier-protein] S-malonyltransferase
VVSGTADNLSKIKERAAEAGAKRCVELDVSGPFHCPYMAKARDGLEKALKDTQIKSPRFPVVCNVDAKPHKEPEKIIDNLAAQVDHKTLWHESVKFISSSGVSTFLEIGPGKVLRGLLRRIDPELKVINVETADDMQNVGVF